MSIIYSGIRVAMQLEKLYIGIRTISYKLDGDQPC